MVQEYKGIYSNDSVCVYALEVPSGCVILTITVLGSTSCFVPDVGIEEIYSHDYKADGIEEPEVLLGYKLVLRKNYI